MVSITLHLQKIWFLIKIDRFLANSELICVFSEELHHSITESKKLHDQTTTMLQQKMDKVKKDLQKQTEDFEDAKNQHKSALEKLTETNNELNMKLDHLADSLVR